MSSNRDCQAWKSDDLRLSTTSNEAAKLFDEVVRQYVVWKENEEYGGIKGTLQKMVQSDPEFVLGNTLAVGLDLMSTRRSTRLDNELASDIARLKTYVNFENITPREKSHCKAILQFAHGEYDSACETWESIIQAHPGDLLAIKFAYESYLIMGNSIMMRDSIGRVLPFWRPSHPLYGYLQGMYAFGLQETNMFTLGERYANDALIVNATDCWATHAKAHCMEMTGRFENGVVFMESTEHQWSKRNMLACHNYWHWALYLIETGEYEQAFSLYDGQLSKRMNKSGAMGNIADSASLLKRFELEGMQVGDRWEDVYKMCRPHIDDHLTVFNDFHCLLSYIGCRHTKDDIVQEYISSLKNFCSSEKHHYSRNLFADVGVKLCEGLVAYSDGEFDNAVKLWYPLKLHVVRMGGSNAQRDIFQQLLIDACMSSQFYVSLAHALINERKLLKENSPLTDRLMNKMLSKHREKLLD